MPVRLRFTAKPITVKNRLSKEVTMRHCGRDGALLQPSFYAAAKPLYLLPHFKRLESQGSHVAAGAEKTSGCA